VASSITIADPKAALTGVVVLAVFVILYFALNSNKNKNPAPEN
jgi:hypothetical protein